MAENKMQNVNKTDYLNFIWKRVFCQKDNNNLQFSIQIIPKPCNLWFWQKFNLLFLNNPYFFKYINQPCYYSTITFWKVWRDKQLLIKDFCKKMFFTMIHSPFKQWALNLEADEFSNWQSDSLRRHSTVLLKWNNLKRT